ncbi:hypothetical protein PPYR_09497 [Photinus pyralis]|uniref:RING-type domain-containing protein n=1 Tax=Photinus pyralis TaxID=7054 RepID=A0A5N4AMG5_PHOPY|nr:hypothetical protein PPYR_09497 [Photinus pyralis]
MQITLQSLTFGTVLVVAVGTVLYYYFKRNNNNTHTQDDSDDGEFPFGGPVDERARRRRNGSLGDTKCVICLDPLRIFITQSLPCRHVLHLHCFRLWIRGNQATPVCPVCGRSAF